MVAAAALCTRWPGAWQLGGARVQLRPRVARATPRLCCLPPAAGAGTAVISAAVAAPTATAPDPPCERQQRDQGPLQEQEQMQQQEGQHQQRASDEDHQHHRHAALRAHHHHHGHVHLPHQNNTTQHKQQQHHHHHQQRHQQPPRSASGRVLRSPALISACGEATCTVRDAGGALSLQSYMRLPVEQYYILDPSQIRFLESNVFQLAVPPINLLGTSLQPRLRVAVATREDAVVLEATGCQLRGSGALGALDDKFSMTFTTTITWSNGEGAAGEAGDGDAEEGTADSSGAEGGGAWRSLRGGLQQWGIGGGGGDSGDRGARGSLTGSADIQVFCEVIPPFHLMPREALEVSCNAVLRGLVRSLLPMFMRQLAADYRRWASDESYRLERASRGRPLSEAMT